MLPASQERRLRVVTGTLLPYLVVACGSGCHEADAGAPDEASVMDASRDARRFDSTSGAADGAPVAVTDSAVDRRAADATGTADGRADGPFAATTSLASLSQNNTSACGSGAPPCLHAWSPTNTVTYGPGSSYAGTTRSVEAFWDNAVPAAPQEAGSAYGYVSKVPVRAMLPGYASVPIWVETQNWWGSGSGHISNGEVTSDVAQMKNQVADHISRGFGGQVVDWYGKGTAADLALPTIRAAAEASSGAYGFAVMIDKAYFQYSCPGGESAACVDEALAYLASSYGASPAYLKDAQGRPIVFFFVNSYYPSEYAILTDGGIDAGGTSFEMYEPNGLPGHEPPGTVGEYAWVNPSDLAYATSTGSAGTFASAPDFGFQDLTAFFKAAASNPSSFLISEAHKGFDDNLASWSLNRVIDPRCGETWLQTFHHTGAFGGSPAFQGSLDFLASGHRLDMVLVDTWDDYEEGSEIETGIDNCMSALDVSLAGTTLTWAPTWGTDPMDASVSGSESTLFAYSVYAAEAGGADVMHLGDLACAAGACPHTVDVSGYGLRGGPYVFYVQAVGMPSIVNHLAGPTVATFSAP